METQMDVKVAVDVAKKYISTLYDDEGIDNIGLEEVKFDDARKQWKVTIGFLRPWDRAGYIAKNLEHLEGSGPAGWKRRSFKVVEIDDKSARVIAVTHRVLN